MQHNVLRYFGVGKIASTVEGVDHVHLFETGNKMDCSNFERVQVISYIKNLIQHSFVKVNSICR